MSIKKFKECGLYLVNGFDTTCSYNDNNLILFIFKLQENN